MSKSLNNGIDPAELIESYGADALRFTLASLSTVHGQDICVDPVKIASSRNFINKIWNASRFALEKIQAEEVKNNPSQANHWDLWIQDQWNHLFDKLNDHLEHFRFNEASNAIYAFFWDDFCDWYIEVSKFSLNSKLLHDILRKTLILMHPIIPFITESLWTYFDESNQSIMKAKLPEKFALSNENTTLSQRDVVFIQQVVKSIRQLKSEFNLASPEGIVIHAKCSDPIKTNQILAFSKDIQALAKVEQLVPYKNLPQNAVSAVVYSDLEIWMPLPGLVDIQKDIELKVKKMEKLQKELEKIEQKINNQNFIQHAPKNLLEEAQTQYQETKAQMSHLQQRITDLSQMKA